MPFPQFARFPFDVRCLIWAAILPDDDPPCLYIYDDKCKGYLLSGNGKTPEGKDASLYTKIAVPTIFYVSHEAREVVLHWAKRFRQGRDNNDLVRKWDPRKDTLYISEEVWCFFYLLSMKLPRGIRSVAFSVEEAAADMPSLVSIIIQLPDLEEVLLVVRELRTPLENVTTAKKSRWDFIPWSIANWEFIRHKMRCLLLLNRDSGFWFNDAIDAFDAFETPGALEALDNDEDIDAFFHVVKAIQR